MVRKVTKSGNFSEAVFFIKILYLNKAKFSKSEQDLLLNKYTDILPRE